MWYIYTMEYVYMLPFPSPGDLPNPGTEPGSPVLQAVSCTAGRFFTNWAPREALNPKKEAAKGATESPLTPTVMEQFQLISLVLPSSSWALEAQGRFGGGLWWEAHFGVTVRITDQMHGQA